MYRSQSHDEYWANFYHAHTQKIRDFAMKHLSMTYLEVELNDKMGELLERYTGVSASCVMDCHPGPKWVRKNNATSRCHPVGENPALKNAKPDVNEEGGSNNNEGEEESDNEEEEEVDSGDDQISNSDNEEAEE
jgi:hypothetical protein